MVEEVEDSDFISLMSGSRYTLYQSAEDFQEQRMENNVEELKGFKGVSWRRTFCDGVRVVDFVLVSSSTGEVPARTLFEEGLCSVGLNLEEETLRVSKGATLRFLKIHAPREVLTSYAEILRLRMPMKQIPDEERRNEGSEDGFIITEVKSLVASIIEKCNIGIEVGKFKLTAEYSKHKSYLFEEESPDFFTPQIRTLVVDFILERTKFSTTGEGKCVGIQKLISEDVYRAAYPLHDGSAKEAGCLRGYLGEEWAELKHWARFQPLDEIREYFGVAHALYFAWLGFYTHMLIPASIVGLIVFGYGCFTAHLDTLSDEICASNITMCPLCDRTCDYWRLSETCGYAKATYLFDNPLTVVFAVFMSFWATLFLELWKRYSASIVHRWGLTEFSAQSEPPRSEYLARISSLSSAREKANVFTGLTEPYVPFWRVRLPARLLSYSIIFILILIAIMAVFAVVLYRMSVLASLSLSSDSDWTSYAILFIPATAACINLACTMTLNWVYNKLAVYLTELELHRSRTEFDEALTVKIYLFQFVNYYTSIMYIAFLKGKFVGYPAKYNRIFGYRQEECMPGGCLMELCIQLAVIMVGQQAYNGLIEMLLPALWKRLNSLGMKREESEQSEEARRGQWSEDYKLLDWGPHGLFYEYLEMVMQYGFVTIFVTAFPLAPLFALVNNVFEMRLDAKKFLKYYRRPVPRRAPDIGVWFSILKVLASLAVVSNGFIIAFSSNFIPKLVYQLTVSRDSTEMGYLENSLAFFNISDFPPSTAPRNSTHNLTVCRYWEYRESYDVSDPARKYKRPAIYWHVLAARLAFIVIFQNVVSLVMTAVQWCIPDVPAKLRDQIKREAYLTNEMIIKHETARFQETHTGESVTAANPRRRVEVEEIELRPIGKRNSAFIENERKRL